MRAQKMRQKFYFMQNKDYLVIAGNKSIGAAKNVKKKDRTLRMSAILVLNHKITPLVVLEKSP